MSTEAPIGSVKSAAVTAIGLATVLRGFFFVAVAVSGVCSVATLQISIGPDDPKPLATVLWIAAAPFVFLICIGFLCTGILALLAGPGVVFRKRWGRFLALIGCPVAVLWGWSSLWVYAQEIAGRMSYLAFGTAEFLYGFLTLVALLARRADFAEPQPPRKPKAEKFTWD
jgi:hypothetical protein